MNCDPFDDDYNAVLSQMPEPMVTVDTLSIPKEFDDDLDIVLSQIAAEMENEYKCTESLSNMTLSQCFAEYLEPDDDLPNFFVDLQTDIDFEMDDHTEKKRFGEPASNSDIEKLINSQKNPNTEKNTKWATEAFQKLRETRNKEGENIPPLKLMEAEIMNTNLQRFVVEVRKQDGTEYPPKSLYYIVCGLLRHLRNEEIYDKNFLSETDIRFAVFRKVLDAKMKELASRGLGSTVKQADPITQKDEQKIWDSGVFGSDNSVSLQQTVFFYNCKLFGMRGYDEHRNLDCEQFQIGNDEKGQYIHFIGRTNKTFKCGLNHLQLKNKDIKHYCSNSEGERCIVDYYKMYINALGNRGSFYRRPLAGSSIRYSEQVVGVNKLKGLMKEIATKAGLEGNFTNHSGKRSCATQLYGAGIPEQEIMSRTGHRSETAVRKYKRSSDKILNEVSDVLNPTVFKKERLKNASSENSMEVCDKKKMKAVSVAMQDITNFAEQKPVFNNCTFNF